MASLRDRWRRSLICEYFAVMAPADRAVALVALLLAAAIAAAFSALLQSREPAPSLPAAPIAMNFAAVSK